MDVAKPLLNLYRMASWSTCCIASDFFVHRINDVKWYYIIQSPVGTRPRAWQRGRFLHTINIIAHNIRRCIAKHYRTYR
jgi:hypothetical protein